MKYPWECFLERKHRSLADKMKEVCEMEFTIETTNDGKVHRFYLLSMLPDWQTGLVFYIGTYKLGIWNYREVESEVD